ncbi:MAG: hypothetical protein R2729_01880 [Bryobacteraceae bacterium]
MNPPACRFHHHPNVLPRDESLSTVSQRLQILRTESVVGPRRSGKHINQALADAPCTELAFNAVEHASENPARRRPPGSPVNKK